jgi:hypothetical protein
VDTARQALQPYFPDPPVLLALFEDPEFGDPPKLHLVVVPAMAPCRERLCYRARIPLSFDWHVY